MTTHYEIKVDMDGETRTFHVRSDADIEELRKAGSSLNLMQFKVRDVHLRNVRSAAEVLRELARVTLEKHRAATGTSTKSLLNA